MKKNGVISLCRSAEHGFTIVELLVALVIFGMLSAAGVALLSFSVAAQENADKRLEQLSEVRRTAAILTADLAQATPRIWRDEGGGARPAFVGGSGQESAPLMTLVRRGWENLDNARRPSVQKVEYRLVGNLLERRAWRFVDGAQPMQPLVLLEGVTGIRMRYRDREGGWRDRWDPQRVIDLPVAVELSVDTQNYGTVRQLFLVGAGA